MFTMFGYFLFRDHISEVPTSESAHVSVPMPESELVIGAFDPIPTSESISVGTDATTNEMKYGLFWADEWSSLPEGEHLQVICRILAWLIFSILVRIYFVKHRHDRPTRFCNKGLIEDVLVEKMEDEFHARLQTQLHSDRFKRDH